MQLLPDPPMGAPSGATTIDTRSACTFRVSVIWGRGHSSAGRAPGLQPGGRRFDPDWLHQPRACFFSKRGNPHLPPAAHESAMIRGHLNGTPRGVTQRWSRLIARGSTPRVFFNNPEKFFVLTLSFQAKLFNTHREVRLLRVRLRMSRSHRTIESAKGSLGN